MKEKCFAYDSEKGNCSVLKQLEKLSKDFKETKQPIRVKKRKVNILNSLREWLKLEK